MGRVLLSATVLLGIAVIAVQSSFFDGKSSKVVNLTPEDFDKKVIESTDLWIVEFYAPWCGHCKNLAPEWEKAAAQLEGSNVHIAAVDADKFGELGGRFQVQGFPTIKVFGDDKSNPSNYEDQRRAASIVKFAKNEWKRIDNKRNGIDAPVEEEEPEGPPSSEFYDGTDVVELSDAMIDAEIAKGKDGWIIEFYAPWCGHCKNLVPEWKKAATLLQGSIKVGAIDATAHKKWAGKFTVNGFPTIKFIPPGNPDAAEDYQGARSSEAIAEFGFKKAELFPSGPIEVNQIENQESLESLCGKKTLCVIFVVPHVFDTTAAGRNKLIEQFAAVAGKLRSRSAAFGWIVGGEHERFETGFNLHGSYPTYIALNYKNLRATTHKGSFTTENIVASIKKVFEGKIAVSALKELPKLSKGVALWDGKDYVVPEEDE